MGNKAGSRLCISKPITITILIALMIIIHSFGRLPLAHGLIPNDPVGNPWHLDAIKVHSVWDHGYSFYASEAIGLCVIGEAVIDDQNGDLNITEKASFSWDINFTSYLPYPTTSSSSHEAAVASVAASIINNGIGVAGIVNAPLYSAWPWGSYPTEDVDSYRIYLQKLIDIFEWGTSFGKIVFTMSFLATVYLLDFDDPVLVKLQNKVSELYESGDALFFAGCDNTLYPLHPKDIPQSLPYFRVIGRFDSGGNFNEGGYGDKLFLIAPAGGVPAYRQTTRDYGTFGGSSCSTPIAAASAVLLWNQFPWASNGQIEDALVWGAIDILGEGWDDRSGYGKLNVERAREYLAEYVPSANSYRLNWSNINQNPITTSHNETTNSTASTWPLNVYVSASISIIVSLIVLVVVIKKRETANVWFRNYSTL
ncbi:MAG: S8 family serine peptidase [Candidatus Thorarchaeota archaeon]